MQVRMGISRSDRSRKNYLISGIDYPNLTIQRYKKYSRKPKVFRINLSWILHIFTHVNPGGRAWVFLYIFVCSRCEKSPVPPKISKITEKTKFWKWFSEKCLPTILQSYKCISFQTIIIIYLSYYQYVMCVCVFLWFCRKCCRIVGRCRI